MRRSCPALAVVWLAVSLAPAPAADAVHWIWHPDDPDSAPAATRYFRKVVPLTAFTRTFDEGTLDIAADDEFQVWVNGQYVGDGKTWKHVPRFDVTKLLVSGPNVIAVAARNTSPGPAGLLAKLSYVPNGQWRMSVVSDDSWVCADQVRDGWQAVDFDDSQWKKVKVIGRYGQVGPWKGMVWAGGGQDDRFTVPDGFRVEQAVVKPDGNDPFSLINLGFDAKGRLLVSQERGPILLCSEPGPDGRLTSVKPYCTLVKNCQGICWIDDALYLVGDGPKGVGLYRCKDTDGDDRIDSAELLHKFKGGMAEHGPHAVLHGPDGHIYLVLGNHAWAQPGKLAANSPLTRWPTGHFGPDQGQPKTTEDVLIPRLNDGRGHAANILAPGGTIWRCDKDGQNFALVAAGFRNHYDAAFRPDGELFTFDSDMEWDEGLPWYRPVRVCHCPPGADFVWRTGAANTPNYYIDSLPPLAETGRGSPVGVEVYDHPAFGPKYRGAVLMADWAVGVIFAVLPEKSGAGYTATVEKFCVGAPMNVTDLSVGPDGAVYFTMGGRGTQGGVFRIVRDGQPQSDPSAFSFAQTESAWGRAKLAAATNPAELLQMARDTARPGEHRARALLLLHHFGTAPDVESLTALARDANADVRAAAVLMLGTTADDAVKPVLIETLRDPDKFVRRRACEALIRAGFEPPVAALIPLLADDDRFLRTAARLVLQRIDPNKWAAALIDADDHLVALEAIVALTKVHRAAEFGDEIFDRLHRHTPQDDVEMLLNHLRVTQLALIHCPQRPGSVRGTALDLVEMFPHADNRVNRELAILIAHLGKEQILDDTAASKLFHALMKEADPRQQIYYFYCMRILHHGWTPEQKQSVLKWFDTTRHWKGGHSFTPFLENILRDFAGGFNKDDRSAAWKSASEMPHAAAALIRAAKADDLPSAGQIAELYFSTRSPGPEANELRSALLDAMVRHGGSDAGEFLRRVADDEPAQAEAVAKALAQKPAEADFAYLVRGLTSNNPVLNSECLDALLKLRSKPKPEDGDAFRALLETARRVHAGGKWKSVLLLRKWTGGKTFGGDKDQAAAELAAWETWYGQTYPTHKPLAGSSATAAGGGKYRFDELRDFLENDPAGRGDAVRGKAVFTKANCIKCHKYGDDGEGIGPDLTALSKRFKRTDTLEAILYPSKVISDQYRSVTILTGRGITVTGIAAPNADKVTVVISDGSKVVLDKDDIESQHASLVSVMPENLLDDLTKQEIADLFAYMESDPAK